MNCHPASMTTIAIIDDDQDLQGLLVRLLQQEGWQTLSALTVHDGDRLLSQNSPAIALIDVMLPDGSGLDACRRWRIQYPEVSLLMISARGEPLDRVVGLEIGADDYLSKPFEKRELVARIRALLRRRPQALNDSAEDFQFNGLSLDPLHRKATIRGVPVPLTGIEFKLLVALASAAGRTLSREALSASVQTGRYRPLDRTVDVQIGRLRRKLQEADQNHEWIRTQRGEGYVFVPSGATTTTRGGHVAPAF